MELSVILCTHNPREDFLRETLEALKGQSLPQNRWELLLVDNASKPPLAGKWNLAWHPHARHVCEEALGLTPARLRGIAEARAPLLVFVDDDNLLATDYLDRALEISREFPFLGAWGGNLVPRYEIPPPEWAKPYVGMLAIREVTTDVWSNIQKWSAGTCPAGAGMCIRSTVAREYARYCREDPKRAALDRKGNSLIGCGDLDMAFTACDMGMGNGMFARLRLTHIIPEGRLRKDYLLRLCEANGASTVVLDSFREKLLAVGQREPFPLPARIACKLLKVLGLKSEAQRIAEEFGACYRRGREAGGRLLSNSVPEEV
jgi:hypothetical protein